MIPLTKTTVAVPARETLIVGLFVLEGVAAGPEMTMTRKERRGETEAAEVPATTVLSLARKNRRWSMSKFPWYLVHVPVLIPSGLLLARAGTCQSLTPLSDSSRPSPSYDDGPQDPYLDEPKEDDSEARSVFVSQLAARMTARDLGYFFEDKLGENSVLDSRIVTDRLSRRSKG